MKIKEFIRKLKKMISRSYRKRKKHIAIQCEDNGDSLKIKNPLKISEQNSIIIRENIETVTSKNESVLLSDIDNGSTGLLKQQDSNEDVEKNGVATDLVEIQTGEQLKREMSNMPEECQQLNKLVFEEFEMLRKYLLEKRVYFMQDDIECKFFEWLSKKITSKKFSECCNIYEKIKDFCVENEQLFNETNRQIFQKKFHGLLDSIKTHEDLCGKMHKIKYLMELYSRFLGEQQFGDESIIWEDSIPKSNKRVADESKKSEKNDKIILEQNVSVQLDLNQKEDLLITSSEENINIIRSIAMSDVKSEKDFVEASKDVIALNETTEKGDSFQNSEIPFSIQKELPKEDIADKEIDKENDFEVADDSVNLYRQNISFQTREELSASFEDKRQVKKNKISNKYLELLRHSSSSSPQAQLRNKIVDYFADAVLLCEIPINDDEYKILCEYIRNKYENLVETRQKVGTDIMFTVGMVQIGMRTYDNTFWPHVAEAIGVKNIPTSRHELFGECVTQTLLNFGKAVSEGREYVTTILLHGFIVDSYAYRVFEYLFQYYNIDLKRDIRDLQDDDLEYLCASIINPYAKRRQLLSNYMGMSIRAERKFAKQVLLSILKLIDQSFWNEYTENITLPGRLETFFQKWRENSSFYKTEKEKKVNGKVLSNKQYNFRTPRLHCDMNNAEFSIILPEQLIRSEAVNEGEHFYWIISHNGNSRVKSCSVKEGFSGYSTYEEIINIEPSEQFDAYDFSFMRGNVVVRKFIWKAKKANFFTHDGIWVNSEKIMPGEFFAYSNMECKIISEGLLGTRVRNGLSFYEFDFSEGEVVYVEGEANYYVGQIPVNGVSHEGRIIGMKLVYNHKEYDVYNKIPSIIFSAEEDQINGIAVIVNGKVFHLTRTIFVDLQIENSKNKYYLLDGKMVPGIIEGINKIIMDFPATSKKIAITFSYIYGLVYEFEDSPYVFQPKGTLKVDLSQNINLKLIDENGSNLKNFEIAKLTDSKISRKIQIGLEQYNLIFDVPVFEYSIDEKNWSIEHPKDLWHNDIPSVYYVKCAGNRISFGVDSSYGYQSFSYSKNAKDIFVCDIMKMKTYLYDGWIKKDIYIMFEKTKYNFVRILMKSYLVNATLEADLNTEQLIARFELLGKNVYYADFSCHGELLLEKEPIINGKITASIPVMSAEYTLTVFEQENEFTFDDEYSYVGTKIVSIINPGELTGRRFKAQNIISLNDGTLYEINSVYYGYLEEKVDNHHYKGLLVEVFHETNITKASEIIVYIPDLNHLEQVVIKFLDEYKEEMEYEYDHYANRVVECELSYISKSEAYRRYEMLDSDSFRWNVLYDQMIKDYTVQARKKIQTTENTRKKSLVWKN